MARIAGITYINVDGVPLELKGSINVAPGSFSRESVVGLDGVHGYKEIPIVPFVECTITDSAGIDLNAIEKLANVTVTVELANGKTAVVNQATQVNQLENNPEEAEVTVRFEGTSGAWLN
jgi:hypothetical protein